VTLTSSIRNPSPGASAGARLFTNDSPYFFAAAAALAFGILLMITDELMVRLAEGHVDYDVPVVGLVNVWIAWQAVFAAMLLLFLAAIAVIIWRARP
jgi:hypothetical protein